jgi:methanol metabolism-related c-type cytochrome
MTTRLLAAAAAGILCLGLATAPLAVGRTEEEKPYKIENGKVDRETFNGYRRYGNSCLQCHGPDGAGSSYGPNLVESLKKMDFVAFSDVVINGRQNVTSSQQNVMPSFGHVEDVALYINDIYGYLKARADGALGRGRPQRMDN